MSDEQLNEIQAKAEADPCFTEEEKRVIREIIRVYRGWRFFGKVVRGLVVAVGTVAAAAAAIVKLLNGGA